MFFNKIPLNTKVFKCNDEDAERIFKELNVLPINNYYSDNFKCQVNTFILTKKLLKFAKNNGIGEINE